MYDRILVPTDGGQEMDSVSEHALDLAELCDGEVHVLYVVDESAYQSVPSDARDRVRGALKEDGQDATKAVAERALERGLDVKREIRWGNPAAAVLSYARENEVDLIVMGTHGRTGYERYILGSVAEKVVRASTRPVLAVYVGEEESDEDIVKLG